MKAAPDVLLLITTGCAHCPSMMHVPTLIEYSHHQDASIRNNACYYLGLSKETAAIKSIESLLDDENTEVRETATETLAKLKALI